MKKGDPKKEIILSRDFSRYPGGRYRIHGDYSGEQFRETILEPSFKRGERVVIDLNGAFTIPPSFLDEAFGALCRKYGVEAVKNRFEFRLEDDEDAIKELEKIFASKSKAK